MIKGRRFQQSSSSGSGSSSSSTPFLHCQSRKMRRRNVSKKIFETHSSGSRRISVQSRLHSNMGPFREREINKTKRKGIGQRKEGDGNFV